MEVYIEPVVSTPHLVVVGRSPMSHTLCDLARGARVARRPRSTARTSRRPTSIPDAVVVVATQGHGDEEAVEHAVNGIARVRRACRVAQARRGGARVPRRSGCAAAPARSCAGASRARPRPHDAHRDRGVDPRRARAAASIRRARVRSRRQRSIAARDRDRPGLRHDRHDLARSALSLERDGVTYYFCGAGCRTSFAKEARC